MPNSAQRVKEHPVLPEVLGHHRTLPHGESSIAWQQRARLPVIARVRNVFSVWVPRQTKFVNLRRNHEQCRCCTYGKHMSRMWGHHVAEMSNTWRLKTPELDSKTLTLLKAAGTLLSAVSMFMCSHCFDVILIFQHLREVSRFSHFHVFHVSDMFHVFLLCDPSRNMSSHKQVWKR